MHESGIDLNDFGFDSDHPISDLTVFDTVLTFDGGGAYLGMVIARPLDASTRSIKRFAEKQRRYLDAFFSEQGQREWGTPKPGKMKIYVRIHPASSPSALAMLHSFEEEASARGIEVKVSHNIVE